MESRAYCGLMAFRMHTSINGRQIKNPAVRAMVAVLGVMVALGLVAMVMLVALPLAALAIGAAVVGGLAAAFLPRLRRRQTDPTTQLPRRQREAQRVEPAAPPRTLD